MYRYCADNAVTYTSEDIVLFRESPFACWMERLTLESPEHGILPDLRSQAPGIPTERQDELAETLRLEGKNVALIDWDDDEPTRRRGTLEALRRGVDFIVNGQLALGPLSGSANLLMRTSGYSEFGNHLYIPCDTEVKTTLNSTFRLCFLADLLHSLQGQLPPRMLIIRGGADLLPLETEDHIYHYRAVKQRFMAAMRDFRKHRMPDPAESSHFGRWSDCANEVLKQRALRGDEAAEEASSGGELATAGERFAPAVAMVPAGERARQAAQAAAHVPQYLRVSRGIQVGDTLAAQARRLPPVALRRAQGAAPALRPALDDALQNLEFIGSSGHPPALGEPLCARERGPGVAPAQTGPRGALAAEPGRRAHPLDSVGFSVHGVEKPAPTGCSAAVAAATPLPTRSTDSPEIDAYCFHDSDYALPGEALFAPLATAPDEAAGLALEADAFPRPPTSSRALRTGDGGGD